MMPIFQLMGYLTDREKRIIELLVKGYRTREISKELEISDTSVSRSIRNIKFKLIEIEEDIHFLERNGLVERDGLNIKKNLTR